MTTTDLRESLHFENREFFDVKVNELRHEAYKLALDLGLPHRRVEEWKYTNLSGVSFQSNDSINQNIDINKYLLPHFHNIILVDGQLHQQSEQTAFNISKLNTQNLTVLTKNKNLLAHDFSNAFNLASMQTAYHLDLEANTIVTKPVVIFHIHTTLEAKLKSTHLSFNIQKNSKVDVLEVYLTTDETSSVSLSVGHSINVQENAVFNHTQLQTLSPFAYFLNNNKAQVEKGAKYNSVSTLIGAKLSRTNIAINLNQSMASCMAHGLYALQSDQHCDVMSSVFHHAEETQTEQLFKGILNEKSRGIFTGLIHMDKVAQRSSASQLNKNLLLSQGAHANSRPQLEIFADDVKCSHGSTTGQLNQDELFYFMARGIKKQKALSMLAHAYSYDVLLKIDNANIRNFIQKDLQEKFESKVFKDNHA